MTCSDFSAQIKNQLHKIFCSSVRKKFMEFFSHFSRNPFLKKIIPPVNSFSWTTVALDLSKGLSGDGNAASNFSLINGIHSLCWIRFFNCWRVSGNELGSTSFLVRSQPMVSCCLACLVWRRNVLIGSRSEWSPEEGEWREVSRVTSRAYRWVELGVKPWETELQVMKACVTWRACIDRCLEKRLPVPC